MFRAARPRLLRDGAVVVTTAVAATLAFAGTAQAVALSSLTDESFTAATTVDSGWIAPGAGNTACMTASSDSTQRPVAGCQSPAIDAPGAGTLRLTGNGGNLVGTVYNTTSLPTAQGLDVTFNTYQWNGTGADGISFVLAATDPTDPKPPSTLGPLGGSLGYSATGSSAAGVSYGYLGFGLDVYGNFEGSGFGGSGCPASSATPQSITVRGPGNANAGYCVLSTTALSGGATLDAAAATTRPAPVPVEIAVNPSSSATTTASGLAVAAMQWSMRVTPLNGTARTLSGSLPTAATLAGYGFPSDWYDPATGLPYQLTFGWAASTGGSNEIHEINTLTSTTLNGTLPSYDLAISDDQSGTFLAGNHATVSVTPSLDATQGAESKPLTVITTLPAGLVPAAVTTSGYDCTTSGQTVRCVYTPAGSLPAGTSLTAIEIPVTVGAAGSYTITSKVSSNDGNPQTASSTVTVTAMAATASPASVTYGTPTSLAVTGVPASATGTVSFVSGGVTLCTATLPVTSCSPVAGLAVGTYPVTATYSGDSAFASQATGTSFSVTKAPTSTVPTAAPSSSAYGSTTTLSVSSLPADATGAITFSSGLTSLCSVSLPATSCTTAADLDVASYPVSASYAGDGNYLGSSGTTTFAVTKADTTLTASASSPKVSYGTSDSLAVTGVPAGADGTVTYTSGGTTLCTATLPSTSCSTPTSLEPGTYAFTATYSGDANHTSAGASATFDVVKASTSLVAGVSDTVITYGTTDTLSLSGLPNDAGGTVTFASGGTTLCTATLPATGCSTSAGLDAGSYPVTATYSGDVHYTGSSASTSFDVSRGASTGLTAAATPVATAYESADTLSFSGLAVGSTGTVTFTSAGTTLCVATLPDTSCAAPSNLDVATYSVTAAYSGDANHQPATASTTFDVVKAATALTAAAVDASAVYGTADTLTFGGLPASASGSVTFTAGGDTLCTATLPGTSCQTPAGLHVGSYVVTATYAGDGNHVGSTASTAFGVVKAPTAISAGVASSTVPFGTAQTISWSGLPAGATGTVSVTSAGQAVCTVTVPVASCTAPADLGVGTHPVTVAYSGDANHQSATSGTTFDVVKAATALQARVSSTTVAEGTGVQLTGTGLPRGAGGTITFVAGGRVLCSVTLPSTTCRTSAGVGAGDYDVTASYSGDDRYLGSSASTAFSVTALTRQTATATTSGGSSTSVPVPHAQDAVSVAVVTKPAHGTVRIVNGQVVYTPDRGYTGSDAAVVKITYADGTITVLTLTVTAQPAAGARSGIGDVLSRLPRTGLSVVPAMVGVGLAAAGAVMVYVSRSREA